MFSSFPLVLLLCATSALLGCALQDSDAGMTNHATTWNGKMFMSRHRRFYKYSLINSVRHLSGLHPNLLLTVSPSQSQTEGMVLYSLGRSPCSRLSLQWQPAAVERYVSSLLSPRLFPFPDMPALFTQMSSTEGKRGVKESGEESCVYFFVRGVHTPQVAPAV